MSRTIWVSVLSTLSLAILMACNSTVEPAPSLSIRLIETSDIHGEVTGIDYFTGETVQRGLVHTAALIRAAQAEQINNLLIDNGDLIQGSPFASWAQQQSAQPNPIIQVLNHLNFDVANIGNHEFNFGLDALWQTYSQAEFPVISSNLEAIANAKLVIPDWLNKTLLLKRQFVADNGQSYPIKIGFVGVVPPQITQWDQQHLAGQINAIDITTATTQGVQQLREQGADIIVLVAHAGMPKHSDQPTDSEQALHSAAQVAGIDAILFGHQHEVFPGTRVYDRLPGVDSEQGTIHGIAAVQPGVYGSHIGIIDLTLTRVDGQWQRHSSRSEVRAITNTVAEDIQRLMRSAHEATSRYVQQPVGRTRVDLDHRYARVEPTASMQLIHKAQQWHTQQISDPAIQAQLAQFPLVSAAAPFVAALTANDPNYTLIEKGSITLGDIGDLYRYPNTLEIVKISAAQLKQWLEGSALGFVAGQAEQPFSFVNPAVASYNVDSFYGLEYVIDPKRASGDRIVAMTYQRQALDPKQQVLVITNNYRATGGGDFAGLDGSQSIYRSPDELQKIIVDYLHHLPEQTYQSETEYNWKVID